MAILGQLAVLIPALRAGWLEQQHVTHYLVVVGALGLFNASLQLVRDGVVDTSVESLVVQVTIDLFALGSLLLLTEGCTIPWRRSSWCMPASVPDLQRLVELLCGRLAAGPDFAVSSSPTTRPRLSRHLRTRLFRVLLTSSCRSSSGR